MRNGLFLLFALVVTHFTVGQRSPEAIPVAFKPNHWEINTGIDRFDFWTGVTFSRKMSAKLSIESSLSLSVVKTFFQQNITPKLALGVGYTYFGTHNKNTNAENIIQLIVDAGVAQTVAKYGSQIQNDAQFFIGHQLIVGKKKAFVCKLRAGSGVRQFYNSNSTLSPMYYNASFSLGYRW
jgi:hypothetical protein